MFDHLLPHLHQAAEVLTSQDTPFRVALIEAGHEFWTAMSFTEEWPPDLRKKANDILERLLEGGTVLTTAAQMDRKAAEEITQEILDLAAELEAVKNERLHPV